MKTPRLHRDHVFARRRMSAYIDGELNPEERARLEHHAAECADCGPALRRLIGITAALRALGPAARRTAGQVSDSRGAAR